MNLGLSRTSCGVSLLNKEKKDIFCDVTIALAGNPNVGKSTLFNELTGLRQHTGNWPGKTVGIATGKCQWGEKTIEFVDLPGTYSLKSNSPEEEIARDYICFSKSKYIAVVCDATCLERNLNLVLQILEIKKNVIVCINLLDEAKKKNIKPDIKKLSEILKVPVIPMVARSKKGIDNLLNTIAQNGNNNNTFKIKYPKEIEDIIEKLEHSLSAINTKDINKRWIAVKLIENDLDVLNKLCEFLGYDLLNDEGITYILNNLKVVETLRFKDFSANCTILAAEYIYGKIINTKHTLKTLREEKIDKFLTGKRTGIPIMLLLLFIIFWLTICGANYPSELLGNILFNFEDILAYTFEYIGIADIITDALVHGAYRTLAWVVSVMLPPMMIFFPLFTILEDLGYLPRIAFNLDNHFKKAGTCGRQSLTMCMGFGCNAAGVVGCRIIESPRERLIATITNNLVPCNGRFPTLIAIISMFIVSSINGFVGTLTSTLVLMLVIVLGILATFFTSKLLSITFLKGVPSSFALELPPYRMPNIWKVIVRSVFDRTLFVLMRAVVVSLPAGLLIWAMANINIEGATLLNIVSGLLDPIAQVFGLDGVILLAFILGSPANEIVIPIIMMTYMNSGIIKDYTSLTALKEILILHGWDIKTAISMLLFCVFHWPCATTLMTIRKETGSIKWTLLSIILPTLIGLSLCFIFNLSMNILA